MKDMMKMGMFLFVISAIAALLLAGTETLTAPRIAANKLAILAKARQEVLPGAIKFTTMKPDPKTPNIKPVSAGFDNNNKLVGIVMELAPKGYGGPIEMVMGMSNEGKISGIKILSQKETPGLGTKLAGSKFLNAFKKLITNNSTPKFKVKKDGGDVDGITAATVSSRAFCRGVTKGCEIFTSTKSKLTQIKSPAESTPQGTGGSK